MTQAEKILLMQDLSARLPYGVMCNRYTNAYELVDMDIKRGLVYLLREEQYVPYSIIRDDEIKPYLRPLSTMTENEFWELKELGISLPSTFKEYYGQMQYYSSGGEWTGVDVEIEDIIKYINYLNEHHFDYRGMIEMGLALPAPEGMYNF